MRVEISNKLEEISKVISTVEEFSKHAELKLNITQAAELALDELLTNTISYGYQDSNPHRITIEIKIVKDALQVVVSDDAIAFNPFELEAPDLAAPVETRELGGLGIHLVKNIMDECSYRRFEEHNIVTLTKKFDPQR